jgi:hypothetical protein
MIEVMLTDWEFKACVDLAVTRLAVSNGGKLNHASTYERTYLRRMHEEIVGACGELAFCKATGRYFTPSVNTFHGVADVDKKIEVRSTDRDDGSLIIRDNDNPQRWYVLVTGSPPKMTVRGFIKGGKARRDEWVRDPHGYRKAWFVPQNALSPLPKDSPKVVAGQQQVHNTKETHGSSLDY